jgi:hypothetical protein
VAPRQRLCEPAGVDGMVAIGQPVEQGDAHATQLYERRLLAS